MTKHELSYKFFPFLIDAFNRDKIPQSALLDKAYWTKFSEKETHEFSWEEVGMVYRKLSETELVVVLSFPEPVRVSDAKHGLIFFDNKRRDIEYYTLERAEPDTASSEKWTVGYVCVDDGLHKNRGPFNQEPTVDNVVNHIYTNFVKRKGLFGRKR